MVRAPETAGGSPTSRSLSRPRALPDRELDRLWLEGDPEALAEAHRRYRRRLEAVAYRIVGNRADAEDVVQRVFLALPRATYRGAASLRTYLHRAACNASVNVLRSRRRRDVMQSQVVAGLAPERDASEGPEAHVLQGEILAAVAKALLAVKPRHRRPLILRVVHGLSNTEIAEREGVPLATVSTWLRRGREELRRALVPMLRDLGRTPL